jgi:hypothetical protein
MVHELNPSAPRFCTTRGDLNPPFVFDVDERSSPAARDRVALNISAGQKASFTHPSHSQSGIWCRTLPILRPLDREKFLESGSGIALFDFPDQGFD